MHVSLQTIAFSLFIPKLFGQHAVVRLNAGDLVMLFVKFIIKLPVDLNLD